MVAQGGRGGAPATGLRPVVEMMFIEFVGVGLDQLTTQAASLRYLSRGGYTAPLTLRAAAGAGLGFGAQHSQMLESWFRGTPGLTVVVPSGAATAYGLLRSAIRSNDPVVFLEHKALYGDREEVVLGEAGVLPLGRARTVRPGQDITVVGLGRTTGTTLAAAEAATGWSAEVIDLLTVAPWDRDAVVDSVRRTRRLAIVEEGPHNGGWSADICDAVVGDVWPDLLAPPLRITGPDAPIPYAGSLEERFLPGADYVREQIDELVTTGRRPAPWWSKEGALR